MVLLPETATCAASGALAFASLSVVLSGAPLFVKSARAPFLKEDNVRVGFSSASNFYRCFND